jgi:hypothetical protein
MTNVTYPNGIVLQYDETLKEGDAITTYYSGFYILTRIEERLNQTPLFHFTQLAKENGTIVKKSKKEKTCDASYCRRVTDSIDTIIAFAVEKVTLLKYLKQICININQHEN